jgi:hypothetical protein
LSTNDVVEREMNDVEFVKYEKDIAAQAEQEATEAAKDSEKKILLNRLGLTAEELRLLLEGN